MCLACAGDWLRAQAENVSLCDPTVVLRAAKCRGISLASQPVRLLTSPPRSGKTSLGTLLAHHASAAGQTVHVLDLSLMLGARLGFENFWRLKTGVSSAEFLDPAVGLSRTFILDEAQVQNSLGQDHPFWRLQKAVNAAPGEAPGTAPRVQVLLLAMYSVQARRDQLDAPIAIPSPGTLSLLELDDSEVEVFYVAFNSTCEEHGCPPTSPALQLAMQLVFSRHVGLLRACVRLF
jgi:hypothetical protein